MSVKFIHAILLVAVGLILLITPSAAGFHTQTSTNIALAKGDPLTISGTGAMNGSVAIWEIGSSFFTYEVIPAEPDGTISWTFGRNTTKSLKSGPLMIIVQDPGKDRQYSLRTSVSDGKRRVSRENSTDLFEIDPSSLNIPAAMDLADRLGGEITHGGTDDSCMLLTVYVEEPALHFQHGNLDEFPVVMEGDQVTFSGTMNMAPENRITVWIEDTAVIEKTGSHIPVRSGTVTAVRTGGLQNRWEYTTDTNGLKPGEYLFGIGWDRSTVSGQNAMIFRIMPHSGGTPPSPDTGSRGTTGGISISPFLSFMYLGQHPNLA